MRRRRSNVAVRRPLDPILVGYSGSDASFSPVTYIASLRWRVPEEYQLWSLNAQGVHEFYPFARVRLFDDFREDTFRTTA